MALPLQGHEIVPRSPLGQGWGAPFFHLQTPEARKLTGEGPSSGGREVCIPYFFRENFQGSMEMGRSNDVSNIYEVPGKRRGTDACLLTYLHCDLGA